MITYRSNTSGNLRAAYSGDCRIGYIEHTKFDRWRWQLSLVHPSGGHGFGIEDDEIAAEESLQKAFTYWLACAGLQPAKEATDGSERTKRIDQGAQGQLCSAREKGKSGPTDNRDSLNGVRPAGKSAQRHQVDLGLTNGFGKQQLDITKQRPAARKAKK